MSLCDFYILLEGYQLDPLLFMHLLLINLFLSCPSASGHAHTLGLSRLSPWHPPNVLMQIEA